MHRFESCTIKKVEHWRTDAFDLWYWRRFLRVPWTARRSNQAILKAIGPEYSLEGLMLKLKLQYFGHMMCSTDLLEETLILGKIEGKRRRDGRGWDGWMASATQRTWVWANSGRWGQESLECCSPWNFKELGMTEQLNKTRSRKTIIRNSNVNWELMDTKEPFMWQCECKAFEA